MLAIADAASLPALNSLLDAVGPAPATIWFETAEHVTDGGKGPAKGMAGLPLRVEPARHDLRTVPRLGGGAHLVTQVRDAGPELLAETADPYVWIACDTATARSLAAYFCKELGLPKHRVTALGYWRAA